MTDDLTKAGSFETSADLISNETKAGVDLSQNLTAARHDNLTVVTVLGRCYNFIREIKSGWDNDGDRGFDEYDEAAELLAVLNAFRLQQHCDAVNSSSVREHGPAREQTDTPLTDAEWHFANLIESELIATGCSTSSEWVRDRIADLERQLAELVDVYNDENQLKCDALEQLAEAKKELDSYLDGRENARLKRQLADSVSKREVARALAEEWGLNWSRGFAPCHSVEIKLYKLGITPDMVKESD